MDGSLGIAGLSDEFGQSQRRTATHYFQDDKRVIETAKNILVGDKRRWHDLRLCFRVPLFGPEVQSNYETYTTKIIFVSRRLLP